MNIPSKADLANTAFQLVTIAIVGVFTLVEFVHLVAGNA